MTNKNYKKRNSIITQESGAYFKIHNHKNSYHLYYHSYTGNSLKLFIYSILKCVLIQVENRIEL